MTLTADHIQRELSTVLAAPVRMRPCLGWDSGRTAGPMRCASRSIKASVLDEWVLARARELFPLHGPFSADLLESDSDRAQESAARDAGKLSALAYMELAAEGRAERTAALAQMDRAQQEHAAAAAERVDPAQAAAWHAQLDP